MIFEFNQQLTPQSLIDIDDIGEFALEAYNEEDGLYYYLIVRTSLGTATMFSCGPVIPDISLLPDGYQTSLNRLQYKEDKLIRAVNTWLNDKGKKLSEARLIPLDDAIDQFVDLGEYLRHYGEEQY